MVIRFLNPVQASQVNPAVMAKRIQSLDGARFGFLSNNKENADKLLRFVAEELKNRFALSGTQFETKMNAGTNCPAGLLDRLTVEVDAVVTAIGD